MRTVLVVSTRLTPARRAVLERLVAPEGRPAFIDRSDANRRIGDPEIAAVLFDGDGAAAGVDLAGTAPQVAVVSIGCAVDGAGPSDAEASDPLAERVAGLLGLLAIMLAEVGRPLDPRERALLDRAGGRP